MQGRNVQRRPSQARRAAWCGWALVMAVLLQASPVAADPPTQEQRLAVIAKPSVVRVWAGFRGEYEVLGETVPVQHAGSGTGFFVTPDGYIITNAHVVELAKLSEIAIKAKFRGELTAYLMRRFPGEAPQLTRAALSRVLDDIPLKRLTKLNHVILPNGDKLPYEIKAYGEPGTGKDAAVIKVATQDAPVLPLSPTKPQVADKILVLGYPGVADLEGMLDAKSQLEATFTDGSVSALKTAASGDPLIQISAAITHGNSGGPALNLRGEVIGLATFGNAEAVQGFNFLVATDIVTKQLGELSVVPKLGDLDQHWRQGLDAYWSQYYSSAIEHFNIVQARFPAHSEVKHVLVDAVTQRAAGKERQPPPPWWVWLAGGGGAVALLGLLTLAWRRTRRTPDRPLTPALAGPSPSHAPQPYPSMSPDAAALGLRPVSGQPVIAGPGVPQAAPPVAASSQPLPSAPPVAALAANQKTVMWGQAVPTPGNPPSAPASAAAPVAATAFGALTLGQLVVTTGKLAGQRLAFGTEGLTIGRQPGACTVVIDDPKISTKHIWLGLERGVLTLIDQGSTNGTYLNDVNRGRVTKTTLNNGDLIILAEPGVATLQVRLTTAT